MGTISRFCIAQTGKTSKMGRRDKGKKKAVAQGSDVFTMFEKTQLQEFKEAFEMIDSNRDGFIDKNDLKSTYMSLGVRNVDDGDIDKMMAEAPGYRLRRRYPRSLQSPRSIWSRQNPKQSSLGCPYLRSLPFQQGRSWCFDGIRPS